MKLKHVRIEWLDVRSESGWITSKDKYLNRPMITTALLGDQDSEESYYFFSTYDPQEGHFADINIVPKSLVKDLRVLYEEDV